MSDQTAVPGRPGLGRAGLAISLVSLAAVVIWAAQQDPPELPSSGPALAALVGAVGLYGVATMIRGERWFWILRRSGIQVERSDAYGLLVVGYMGNNVLPARGGDAIRSYLMARVGATTIREVLGTLVAERVLDSVFLTSLFVVLAYGVLRGIDVPGGQQLLLVAALVAILLALGWLVVQIAIRHKRGREIVEFLAPLARATRELRGSHGLAMIGLTAAIWSVEAVELLAVGTAVDLDLSVGDALYLIAVAGVFLLIPAGPGHLGTLDAGVAFGIHAVGGTGSQAVSFVIALRFVLLLPITLAGLAVLVLRYGGLAGMRLSGTSHR
ncbi:MAG: lysylphosphatidylglycerol synthase transmembrane domain-containing protein [Solirubrobacterales bacterium]